MRKTALILPAIAISLAASAQIYVEPQTDVECTVFLSKERGARPQQGMDICGDYIFCLEDGGYARVFDFRKPDRGPVGSFTLASARKDNHANNASFGIETKKGASFPLLYVTVGKPGVEIDWKCFVESITRKGKKFTSELVQTLTLDPSGWEERGYASIFGAPSWMVDRVRGELWVFSARKRTVKKVTVNEWENQYVATRFRVPSLSEGTEVTLGVDDILDQVVFPFETWFTQAGCVHDGKIYYCFGVGKQNPHYPSRLRVFDTDTRTISARYELQEMIPQEMEDVCLHEGWLYVNTNTNPKKTSATPDIYRLSLPKDVSTAEAKGCTAIQEILRIPEKAGGIYYVREFNKEASKIPEGYEPFYINGFFRHGARHIDDTKTYPDVFGALEGAAGTGNLTEFGQAVLARLLPLKESLLYHEGDLTQIGRRQAEGIGRRMAEHYPEVFRDSPFLKANSTNVLRVTATMNGVIRGISTLFPGNQWTEIADSRSFLPVLNPYGMTCPGKLDIDYRMHDKRGEWFVKYSRFRDSLVNTDAPLSRLFKDIRPVKEEYGSEELCHRLWLMASLMQCLDRQVPLWDIFTKEEILGMAEAENYKYYAQKGAEPVNHGRGWGLASRTLRHIIEEADADIRAGRHGVNLNFGHDGTVMGLLVNLGSGTWAEATARPEEAFDCWRYWNIPMAANIQMVFCRNSMGDVILKVMLNEEDLELPGLTPVSGRYYRWEDFREYYLGHCLRTEEELERTKEL